ncbi:MAG: hypothetical protein ACOYZ7_15620 [Chloroflexota bacterium]
MSKSFQQGYLSQARSKQVTLSRDLTLLDVTMIGAGEAGPALVLAFLLP